jgi:uncharacterized protein YjbJ (UPF0337 family)
MQWNHVEANWKQYQPHLAKRWDKLSAQDLDHIAGKREHLEGRLQDAYGIPREEAKKDVDEFCKSLRSSKGEAAG